MNRREYLAAVASAGAVALAGCSGGGGGPERPYTLLELDAEDSVESKEVVTDLRATDRLVVEGEHGDDTPASRYLIVFWVRDEPGTAQSIYERAYDTRTVSDTFDIPDDGEYEVGLDFGADTEATVTVESND